MVTHKFPDRNFARPQLAVFAFASQNKNIAPLFESRTNMLPSMFSLLTKSKSALLGRIGFCGSGGIRTHVQKGSLAESTCDRTIVNLD